MKIDKEKYYSSQEVSDLFGWKRRDSGRALIKDEIDQSFVKISGTPQRINRLVKGQGLIEYYQKLCKLSKSTKKS